MKKFPNTRRLSHQWVCGEYWNLREKHNQEKTNKQTNKQTNKHTHTNTQNKWLNTTASREVAQMLMSATSKWGLGREVQAASLVCRVRTGPECHEDNLRELTVR